MFFIEALCSTPILHLQKNIATTLFACGESNVREDSPPVAFLPLLPRRPDIVNAGDIPNAAERAHGNRYGSVTIMDKVLVNVRTTGLLLIENPAVTGFLDLEGALKSVDEIVERLFVLDRKSSFGRSQLVSSIAHHPCFFIKALEAGLFEFRDLYLVGVWQVEYWTTALSGLPFRAAPEELQKLSFVPFNPCEVIPHGNRCDIGINKDPSAGSELLGNETTLLKGIVLTN